MAASAGLEALGVALRHQDVAGEPVPVAPPGLVGPAEIEAERHVRAGEQAVERRLEQPPAVEPIVVDAEGVDPGALGEAPLLAHRLGQAQVVEAEIGRQERLHVAGEVRPRPGDAVHSVKPLPHQASFSGQGWNCGR